MFCKSCGAKTGKGDKFCHKCGAGFSTDVQQPVKRLYRSSKQISL